jgi:hypothetical protein
LLHEHLVFIFSPVVSMDVAHVGEVFTKEHSMWLLPYFMLVNPIGFMILTGNEDGPTWTRMLGHLKESCQILSEQGPKRGSEIDGEMDAE